MICWESYAHTWPRWLYQQGIGLYISPIPATWPGMAGYHHFYICCYYQCRHGLWRDYPGGQQGSGNCGSTGPGVPGRQLPSVHPVTEVLWTKGRQYTPIWIRVPANRMGDPWDAIPSGSSMTVKKDKSQAQRTPVLLRPAKTGWGRGRRPFGEFAHKAYFRRVSPSPSGECSQQQAGV